MCCGGGGNSGQRGLEQEEKDLLRMQARVAEQGIQGRNEAMGGFRDFVSRGREMGSLANQEQAGSRAMTDAYTAYGNMNRMRDANMASMGVNPGDARFQRGRDSDGVGMAASAAGGANAARAGVRKESLGLESAGYAGLAGFDPTGALNSMGSTIGNAQRTGMMADAAESQGWGNLAQAGMYGLANADKIGQGIDAIKGWFADGGEVPSYAEGGEVMGMRRYASGGNVYDQAYQQVGQARATGPKTTPYGQTTAGSGVDPMQAIKMAKYAVDKVAGSSLGGGQGLTMGGGGVGLKAPGAFGADIGASIPSVEIGAGMTSGTEAALGAGAGLSEAAAAAAAAESAAAATAAATATEVIAPELLALLLLKDGGRVPSQATSGIGRKQVKGRAENPKGGKVSGPGGPKDDMVMARLSPGEFVMPVGAVQKFGLDRLEKMRQAGLEFEKQRRIA